jgi:hypothetical protein
MQRIEILPSSSEDEDDAEERVAAVRTAPVPEESEDKTLASQQSLASLGCNDPRDVGNCHLGVLWARRDELVERCDDDGWQRLCARPLDIGDQVLRLELVQHLAQRWRNPDCLRSLATALGSLKLVTEDLESQRQCELLASTAFHLAARHGTVAGGLLRELWGAESTRSNLLLCIECGWGRQRASGTLAKLCYAAVSGPLRTCSALLTRDSVLLCRWKTRRWIVWFHLSCAL